MFDRIIFGHHIGLSEHNTPKIQRGIPLLSRVKEPEISATALKERSVNVPPLAGLIKPPLKWAGGKRWLVPHLIPLWKNHNGRRLVEPFCGGLAVTLGLLPDNALLNDINPHAINFYRWLQKGLSSRLQMKYEETFYYDCRRQFNQLIAEKKENTREAAELFYYLNRSGYNGLCRFNSKGEFNVPFGQYKNINYTTDFTPYKSIFANWQFTVKDFSDVDVEPGDFIYADPPYDVEFTKYSKEDFNWDDQVRLAEWLMRHKGPVILSNQATKRIIELYKRSGFKLTFLDAPRMISCTGDRKKAPEVLAVRGL
jgi:DNA adenine methylase